MFNCIDSSIFLEMLASAANNLCNHRQEVDNMNVFPVPDGDTGSNMSMTITACVSNLGECQGKSLETVSKAVANAALRGARGNSGVILSQLIRGVQKSLAGVEKIDCTVMADCFKNAADSAYRAVMKPTEGTILTVARVMSETAQKDLEKFDNVTEFMKHITKSGNEALAKTPQMLPQLKQAGVVDSGGQGLMYLVEGALSYLVNGVAVAGEVTSAVTEVADTSDIAPEDIKFAYCTECIIEKKNSKVDSFRFKTTIEKIGDSMVIVDDEEIIKVHIHTNQPDIVLGEALKLGELSSVKIENMKIQHSDIVKKQPVSEVAENEAPAMEEVTEAEDVPAKKYAFVAVASGDGIADTFRQLGIDAVISGGQTMNPSTEDVLGAINKLRADNVVVFPNNKNIIMAAQQAKDICDCNVIVIPTRSITQAISCMMTYDEDMTPQELEETMTEAMTTAISAQVTYAVRDTVVDDKVIESGDILGLVEGKIKIVEKDVETCVLNIIASCADEDTELVTVFYGENVSEDEADKLNDKLEELYPEVDFSFCSGGQPVYDYILSIE